MRDAHQHPVQPRQRRLPLRPGPGEHPKPLGRRAGLFNWLSSLLPPGPGWSRRSSRAAPASPSRASTVAKIPSLTLTRIVMAMSLSVRNAGSS